MKLTHTLSEQDVISVDAPTPKEAYAKLAAARNVKSVSELKSKDIKGCAALDELKSWKSEDFPELKPLS